MKTLILFLLVMVFPVTNIFAQTANYQTIGSESLDFLKNFAINDIHLTNNIYSLAGTYTIERNNTTIRNAKVINISADSYQVMNQFSSEIGTRLVSEALPSDDGIYFFVSHESVNADSAWLYKVDYNGNVMWKKNFQANLISAAAINSNYIVGVTIYSKAKVMIFDFDGNIVTEFPAYDNKWMLPNHVVIDSNNNIFVSGSIGSNQGNFSSDGIVNKISWTMDSYETVNQKIFIDCNKTFVNIASDGNVYINTEKLYLDYHSGTFKTIRLSAHFDEVWSHEWDGNANSTQSLISWMHGSKLLANGYIMAYGSITEQDNTWNYDDCGAVIYDPNGNMVQEIRIDNVSGGREAFTAVEEFGNELVFTSQGTLYEADNFTVKEKFFGITTVTFDPTAIESDPTNIPSEFTMSQNYPNPFNPSTTIEFAIPSPEYVTLEVFNSIGQTVAVLVKQEHLPAGTHKFHFDGSNLPSGIYFYRLTTGKISQVKRMVLLK